MKKRKIMAFVLPFMTISTFVGCSFIFDKKEEPKHTHTFVEKHDLTNHWKECECGEKIDSSAHDFVLKNTEQATCDHGTISHYIVLVVKQRILMMIFHSNITIF